MYACLKTLPTKQKDEVISFPRSVMSIYWRLVEENYVPLCHYGSIRFYLLFFKRSFSISHVLESKLYIIGNHVAFAV